MITQVFLRAMVAPGTRTWSPNKISQLTQIEKVQRSFTKHIAGLRDLGYHERLQTFLSPKTKREICYYPNLENNRKQVPKPL